MDRRSRSRPSASRVEGRDDDVRRRVPSSSGSDGSAAQPAAETHTRIVYFLRKRNEDVDVGSEAVATATRGQDERRRHEQQEQARAQEEAKREKLRGQQILQGVQAFVQKQQGSPVSPVPRAYPSPVAKASPVARASPMARASPLTKATPSTVEVLEQSLNEKNKSIFRNLQPSQIQRFLESLHNRTGKTPPRQVQGQQQQCQQSSGPVALQQQMQKDPVPNQISQQNLGDIERNKRFNDEYTSLWNLLQEYDARISGTPQRPITPPQKLNFRNFDISFLGPEFASSPRVITPVIKNRPSMGGTPL